MTTGDPPSIAVFHQEKSPDFLMSSIRRSMVDAEEFADWMHPGHGKGAAKTTIRVWLWMVIIRVVLFEGDSR